MIHSVPEARRGCRLIEEYVGPGAFPEALNSSESDLRVRLQRDPADFLAAFSLVRLLGSEQRWSDAAECAWKPVQLANCPRFPAISLRSSFC